MELDAIFKACDIRGVYVEEFGEAEAYAIARAAATVVGGGPVVVGADVRPSSIPLKDAAVQGMIEGGAQVLDIGIVPTPVFYFAKKNLGAAGGVMITASHNPARFNGMKLALGDMPITEEELAQIKQIAETQSFASGQGTVRRRDAIQPYWEFMASTAKQILPRRMRGLSIVVDCGNGCFSDIAPGILRDVGLDVLELFCTPDGTFPNREPNSAVPSNLVSLSQKTRMEGANFGVAFDGDGDRVAFTDEQGVVDPADKVLVLFLEALLQGERGQRVIYDIKSSTVVPEAVRKLGGEALVEKSGHTYIKARMIAENAIFGGELSGHYFYSAIGGGDDGLYSTLIMASILAQSDCPLSQRVSDIPQYATTPDIRVAYTGNPDILEKIADNFPMERVDRLDGVRVDFGDGWGLARMSVTEPAITIRFEARTEARLREIAEEFLAPVPDLAGKALPMCS